MNSTSVRQTAFDRLFTAAASRPDDLDAVLDLAELAQADQRETEALPLLDRACQIIPSQAILWQWRGLLHRAIDEREHAIPAFQRALALAPSDARIAQGLARVLLEAGLPSVEAFDRALALAPGDGPTILGRTAALFAAGEGEAALAYVDALLVQYPTWVDGHRDRIMLAGMLGFGADAFALLHHALAANPTVFELWHLAIHSHATANQPGEVLTLAHAGVNAYGMSPLFAVNQAVALSDLGELSEADAQFALSGPPASADIALHWIRQALRCGRLDEAASLIDQWLYKPGDEILWPYADLVWRMIGDERAEWLGGSGQFVSVMNIADRIGNVSALAQLLSGLHQARHALLDQSVRGGTQTDGALFHRIDPPIKALRAGVLSAVQDYIAALPAVDPRHPMLRCSRDKAPRFAGSWSVRLRAQGRHANHVHPAGMISSAFYVSLPESIGAGDNRAGWFSAGAPQAELGLDLGPCTYVEPSVGTLVLFPSMMWHGTEPFSQGERLTVAFDIAPM